MTAAPCIFIWPDETTGGHQNWFKGCYRAEPRRPLDRPDGPTGTPYVPKALVDELAAALDATYEFIADQYGDAEAQALEGEFVSREARPVWGTICAALAKAHAATVSEGEKG